VGCTFFSLFVAAFPEWGPVVILGVVLDEGLG
jgi:hypothetical protein